MIHQSCTCDIVVIGSRISPALLLGEADGTKHAGTNGAILVEMIIAQIELATGLLVTSGIGNHDPACPQIRLTHAETRPVHRVLHHREEGTANIISLLLRELCTRGP